MDWRPRETLPRDRSVLVTVVPGPLNRAFETAHPQTLAAYVDEDGIICDYGTWVPDTQLNAEHYWRATHWMPFPTPYRPEEPA